MSQKGLSMRKIRELLRLKYELGRSHRKIATSLDIANSAVNDYTKRVAAAGFSWPLPEGLVDAAGDGAVPGADSGAFRPPGCARILAGAGCRGGERDGWGGVLDDLMQGTVLPTSREILERGGRRCPGRGCPCARFEMCSG